ncbi:MAG: hypothetical protein ABI538_13930 [Pseudoxanthomonas sp.]
MIDKDPVGWASAHRSFRSHNNRLVDRMDGPKARPTSRMELISLPEWRKAFPDGKKAFLERKVALPERKNTLPEPLFHGAKGKQVCRKGNQLHRNSSFVFR